MKQIRWRDLSFALAETPAPSLDGSDGVFCSQLMKALPTPEEGLLRRRIDPLCSSIYENETVLWHITEDLGLRMDSQRRSFEVFTTSADALTSTLPLGLSWLTKACNLAKQKLVFPGTLTMWEGAPALITRYPEIDAPAQNSTPVQAELVVWDRKASQWEAWKNPGDPTSVQRLPASGLRRWLIEVSRQGASGCERAPAELKKQIVKTYLHSDEWMLTRAQRAQYYFPLLDAIRSLEVSLLFSNEYAP